MYVVAILCAARLTRLLAFDEWPPTIWLRDRWDAVTRPVADDDHVVREHPWRKLLHCPYCLAPWMLLLVMLAALLAGYRIPGDGVLEQIWWFGASWLGGSYVAAMVVIYDGDD